MTRMSRTLALAAVCGLGLSAALMLTGAGRAAVPAPAGLAVSHTSEDLDFALGAFEAFRNRLDGAPRRPAVQGERGACAAHAWPHIPPACQTAAGRPVRAVRTIAVDLAAR